MWFQFNYCDFSSSFFYDLEFTLQLYLVYSIKVSTLVL